MRSASAVPQNRVPRNPGEAHGIVWHQINDRLGIRPAEYRHAPRTGCQVERRDIVSCLDTLPDYRYQTTFIIHAQMPGASPSSAHPASYRFAPRSPEEP